VFFRYGLKKTSMDDVARAAGLSRQGVYLHFTAKDALFDATVRHVIGQNLQQATRALAGRAPLAERVAAALSSWHAGHIDTGREQMAELLEAASALPGAPLLAAERSFVAALTSALRRAGVARAAQVAATLAAASSGVKHSAQSLADYRARVAPMLSLLLAPSAAAAGPRRAAVRPRGAS
jgi:AcrR family transcriptional regulator